MVLNFVKNEKISLGLLCVLAGGVVIGGLGPFGQLERFDLFERIGLWVVYLSLGLPLLWAIRQTVASLLGSTSQSKRLLICILTAVLATPAVFLIVELLGYSQGRGFPPDASEFTRAISEVFGTAFLVALLLDILLIPKPKEDKTPSSIISPFVNHPALSGTFYALQAEGHYVRIFTPSGDELLDMTFSDALDAVAHKDGAQVHRSWWVARPFAGAVRRKGSAKELELPGDLKIPIARRRLAELREQGWNV